MAAKNQSAEALLRQLKNPFQEKFVKWRLGATNKDKTKGIALAYIDSREVMKRLDEVCGAENWRNTLIEVKDGFICNIDIKLDGEWITRSNAAGNTKVEPIKGGASDAFKRAASVWGVGRYLYYLPNVWVEIKPVGNTYVLAETPELPEWAKPNAHIEKWEDVAEMQAEMNSGADDLDVAEIIDTVDDIRSASTIKELDTLIEKLEPADKVTFANQIAVKRKELLHAAKVQTNSNSSSAA